MMISNEIPVTVATSSKSKFKPAVSAKIDATRAITTITSGVKNAIQNVRIRYLKCDGSHSSSSWRSK